MEPYFLDLALFNFFILSLIGIAVFRRFSEFDNLPKERMGKGYWGTYEVCSDPSCDCHK